MFRVIRIYAHFDLLMTCMNVENEHLNAQDRGGEPAPEQPGHGRHVIPSEHEPGHWGPAHPQGSQGNGEADRPSQGSE